MHAKKEVENVVADHLSCHTFNKCMDALPIRNSFPNEKLFSIFTLPCYADIVNFLSQVKNHLAGVLKIRNASWLRYAIFSIMILIYLSTV